MASWAVELALRSLDEINRLLARTEEELAKLNARRAE
jgi:hypothetical protein